MSQLASSEQEVTHKVLVTQLRPRELVHWALIVESVGAKTWPVLPSVDGRTTYSACIYKSNIQNESVVEKTHSVKVVAFYDRFGAWTSIQGMVGNIHEVAGVEVSNG